MNKTGVHKRRARSEERALSRENQLKSKAEVDTDPWFATAMAVTVAATVTVAVAAMAVPVGAANGTAAAGAVSATNAAMTAMDLLNSRCFLSGYRRCDIAGHGVG